MTRRLRTVDQLVDAFGGHRRQADNNKTVARWLGINTSAVCNWRERKSIPSGWHMRLYLEAEKRGMEVDPKLFGVDAESQVAAPRRKRSAAARTKTVESQAA